MPRLATRIGLVTTLLRAALAGAQFADLEERKGTTPEQRADFSTDTMKTDFTLTDEQVPKVHDLNLKYTKPQQPLREEQGEPLVRLRRMRKLNTERIGQRTGFSRSDKRRCVTGPGACGPAGRRGQKRLLVSTSTERRIEAPLRVIAYTISHLLIFSLSVGCAYVPTTSLRYDPVATAYTGQPRHNVAVLPLEEARGPKLYPGLQGRAFMSYIPLLPYVKVPYERLDESHMLHQKNIGSESSPDEHFTTAFAQEIARDLGESRMFGKVEFAASEADAPDADLFLSGTLRSTEFDVYFTSYMLGMIGVLFWFLPIPMGKDKATVSLDLALRDRAGNMLWSHSSNQQASKIFTMYNSSGESTSSQFRIEIKRYGENKLGIDGDSLWAYHAEALRAALGEAKESLASHLAGAR